MGNTFYFEFEPMLMQWLQDILGEKGVALISNFSAFGEEVMMLLVMGFLYWCYDKKFGVYVGTMGLIASGLNSMVKNVAMRRRPYMVHDEIKCYRPIDKKADLYDVGAQGFSFPSGHSMNSAAVYGSVAYYLKKRLFTIIAFVLPFFVGLSRVVVGMHYPSDVLTGWIGGAIVVLVFTFIYEKAGEERRGLVNLIVFLIFLTGIFFCRTADYFTTIGVMAGCFPALEFEKKYVNFEETSDPKVAVLRLVGGAVIYLGLNTLLKLPFSKAFLASSTMPSFLVRTGRYAIIAFILMGIYPMLFNKKLKNEIGEIDERA
ncbi:MAG: phosphatase PAP2 family protein [Butyrivibrio sp.]|nr:phosphatase PAP2 family protein [Butyrivibrio sp.]